MILAHAKPNRFVVWLNHVKFRLRFKLRKYPVIYIGG